MSMWNIGNILTQRIIALLNKAKNSEDETDLSLLSDSERWEVLHYTEDGISLKELLIALVMLKLAKTPKGLQMIKEWGNQFLRGLFSTLHALGQASAANQVAAWANPYLVAMILRRFGFISNVHMIRFELGISLMAGAGMAEGFIDTLQGFLPFSAPEKGGYPQNIVFSATSEGGQILKEKVEAKGVSPKELEQLRSLLTKEKSE